MCKIVRNCTILLQNTILCLTLIHALAMTLTLTPHPNSNTYPIAIPHLLHLSWLHSTVGGTPVFGWRTDTVLRSTFRGRVTTMWVNRPPKISQLGQLSLSSFRGR